jgi:hypothetical protein
MLQQITKDVTEEAISSPRIQRLSRPSASVIRTNLCEYRVTQCDDEEFGEPNDSRGNPGQSRLYTPGPRPVPTPRTHPVRARIETSKSRPQRAG